MIDNSNLSLYREMFNHVDVVLRAVEHKLGEVTLNRVYYDSDSVAANFTVNAEKHLFRVTIDKSSPVGYNFILDGETLEVVL